MEGEMTNPMMHFELIAKDPAKLRGFYGKLFGWTEEDYPEADYTILKSNAGMGIDLAIGKASTDLPAGPTAYVAVDDVDGYFARVTAEPGVVAVQSPYDIEGMGRFAVFTDPEGNRVGLWAMPGA
jgi:uncharacterized protein